MNDSLNKAKSKFGIDFRLLLLALSFSVLVFLAGAVTQSGGLKLFAVLLLVGLIAIGKAITMRDAQMFPLWCLSLIQASVYDPGKAGK